MTVASQVVRDNLQRVQERIAGAAERVGRNVGSVKLVAVTKYVTPELIVPLVQAGCCDLAENRPQELWRKTDILAQLVSVPIYWHLIGHLQRNKIARTLPLVSMIHSVDSSRLLTALDAVSPSDRKLPVLLEVNISGDVTKQGWSPEALLELTPTLDVLHGILPVGLMGMASLTGGIDRARSDFRKLRELRDRAQAICPATVRLDELSMGMSGDFEVAIEEGATLVRLGSILFEGVV